MSESARFAETADMAEFEYLHTSSRENISGRKGAEQWLEINSLKGEPDLLFQKLVNDSNYLCILGLYDNHPFGFLIAEQTQLQGELSVDIREVFVDPEAREVGIGEVMMDFLLEWAQSASAATLTSRALPGDRELKNFFERYKVTARLIEVVRRL